MRSLIRSWYERYLPEEVTSVLMQMVDHPPFVAGPGKPLEMMRRDHVAIAVRDFHELYVLFEHMQDRGALVQRSPYLWPDEVEGCPAVDLKLKKYMAELDIGSEMIVLLAPFSSNDLIAQTVRRVGNPAVHHIAYRVRDINKQREEILELEGVQQISDLAIDEGKLSQAFFSLDADHRIVELIERAPEYRGNFTCKNVETLTEGEARHARNEQ